MKSIQCTRDFGYQVNLCSRTDEQLGPVGRSQDPPDACSSAPACAVTLFLKAVRCLFGCSHPN